MSLPDLSIYPSSKQGATDLVEALRPVILKLWKNERESKTDDVAAVIRTGSNRVELKSRSLVYSQLRKYNSNSSAETISRLDAPPRNLLSEPPHKELEVHGAIMIWVLIIFKDETVCTMPYTLVRS